MRLSKINFFCEKLTHFLICEAEVQFFMKSKIHFLVKNEHQLSFCFNFNFLTRKLFGIILIFFNTYDYIYIITRVRETGYHVFSGFSGDRGMFLRNRAYSSGECGDFALSAFHCMRVAASDIVYNNDYYYFVI